MSHEKGGFAGPAAKLFQAMGAGVAQLPGGEIASAMERGVIDACRFNNPTLDTRFGARDVAKNYMLSSYHQASETFQFIFNDDRFQSLDPDLQAALIFSGWKYASHSWRYLEVSIMSPANVPIYQFKTVIIAVGILLTMQGIAHVLRCIITIRTGQWPRHEEEVEEVAPVLPKAGPGRSAPAAKHGYRRAEGPSVMTAPQVTMAMIGTFIFIILLGFSIASRRWRWASASAQYDAERMWIAFMRAVREEAGMPMLIQHWIRGFK